MQFKHLPIKGTGIILSALSFNAIGDECSEVVWSDMVLDKYPFIQEYCQDVVEKDGRSFVKVEGKFLSSMAGKARIQLQRPSGEFDDVYVSNALSKDFRAIIDGKATRLRDIPRRSALTVYLPSDRFEIVKHQTEADLNSEIALNDIPVEQEGDDNLISQESMSVASIDQPQPNNTPIASLLAFDESAQTLPATASQVPMLAFAGLLSTLSGALLSVLRLTRRRRSEI